jgi:two-component system CheB/CheR fusion protein
MKRDSETEIESARRTVSELTGAEQALIKSELRRLFQTAQDGILILNAETGSISDVNPYLINMLGYSREEFAEKKLWEVGAFKDMEASRKAFLALRKNEFIRYENLPLKTKDGRLVHTFRGCIWIENMR